MIGDTVGDAGFAFIDKPEDVQPFLDTFHARGHFDIDTARAYGPNAPGASEQRVGLAVKSLPEMNVHTKIHFSGHGSSAGDHETRKIEESIDASLEELGMGKVSTMFLHAPDRRTPFEETVAAMDKAYKAEKFEQWGLCNYTAAEVGEILAICEAKGHIKPAVYQGQYNVICRGGEKDLFPLLRKNNMAFWAYSPGAMGLFSAVNKTTGRWDPKVSTFHFVCLPTNTHHGKTDGGKIHEALYGKTAVQDAAAKVIETANAHGISGHEAALRWVTYHGVLDGKYGDGVVFGVSRLAQLSPTLDSLEAGPLPIDLADAIGAVYEALGNDGPLYHL
jgi:aflatoxin B1 aldehyde reductase